MQVEGSSRQFLPVTLCLTLKFDGGLVSAYLQILSLHEVSAAFISGVVNIQCAVEV